MAVPKALHGKVPFSGQKQWSSNKLDKACLSSQEECLTEKMQQNYLYTAFNPEIYSPHQQSTTKKPIQNLEKTPNYFYKQGQDLFDESKFYMQIKIN